MERALTLSTILFSATLALCQHQVSLDLNNGIANPLHCTLKLDETVVLKITNINPFLYHCTIDGNDVFAYSEATGPWAGVVGWEKKAAEVQEGSTAAQEDAGAPDVDKAKAAEHLALLAALQDLGERRVGLEDSLRKLQNVLVRSAGIMEGLNQEGIDKAVVAKIQAGMVELLKSDPSVQLVEDTTVTLKKLKDMGLQFQRSINAQKVTIEEELSRLRKQTAEQQVKLARMEQNPLPRLLEPVQDASMSVSRAYEELMRLGDFYNALHGITKNSCLRPEEIRKGVIELEEKRDVPSDPARALRAVQDALTKFYDVHDEYLRFWMDDAPENKKDRAAKVATPIKKAVDRIKKDLDDFDYGAHITTSEQVRSAARLEDTYVAVSDPVQAQGDYVEFSYEIKPRVTDAGPCALSTRTGVHKVHVKNGWRIDYGTGLAGIGGIRDDSYRLDADPDVEGNALLVANNGSTAFRPSLVASIHLSPRCCAHVRPQFMAGLALDMTELEQGSFYVGGGLLFGRERILSLHGGVTFLQADVLKTGLVEGRSYARDAIDASALVEQQFKMGWFAGLSYIIIKAKKRE